MEKLKELLEELKTCYLGHCYKCKYFVPGEHCTDSLINKSIEILSEYIRSNDGD